MRQCRVGGWREGGEEVQGGRMEGGGHGAVHVQCVFI